jgi:hypothetical protein
MRYAVISLATMLLCGCNVLDTDVQRGYAQNSRWHTGTAFTTADVRTITQRTHPLLNNDVVCTEPSPDVAKALSTVLSANAQGGNGAVTAGVGLSGGSAEAFADLAGRSTALLGLRDGLFRACEAYANGVIGQDAYALVLTRYGQLMTTLFLGQDITGAAGAEGKASATTVLQSLGNQSAAPATTTPSTAKPKTGEAAAPDPAVAARVSAMLAAASGIDLPGKVWLAATDAAAPAAAAKPAPTSATDATGTTTGAATTTPAKAPAATEANPSAVAALTLGRMNEDYFDLDSNLLHLLVVSCISEGDPTRLRTPLVPAGSPPPAVPAQQLTNTWLKNICDKLDLDKMIQIETNAPKRPAPIDPQTAAPATAGTQTKPAAAKAVAVVDALVVRVQLALQAQPNCPGCNPGKPDGIAGPATTKAVEAFQTARGLTVNGNPKDPKTMAKLGVTGAAAGDATPATLVGL